MKTKQPLLIICLMISIILISGCTQINQVDCEEPYILVEDKCCLDRNNNNICDKDEEIKPETEESEQLSCKDECNPSPYLDSARCEGKIYFACEKQADGCYDKINKGKVIGKCGVECLTNSDCSHNEECKNNKCVTKDMSLGQSIYLTDNIKFTVKNAKTTVDYVTVSDDGYIYPYKPDQPDYGYLWIHVSAENHGDTITEAPSDYYMKVLVSGIEMEKDIPTYSIPDLYEGGDLNPEAKMEGWIIYAIPKNAKDVQFILKLSNADAIWKIPNSKINFQERNLDNLSNGQSIIYGSDKDYFEMSILHKETRESYSYRSSYSDWIYTEKASPGNKFIFINVTAINLGSRKINVPCPYDMKLITGGKQYSYVSYYGENSYRDACGDIYPGVTASGLVVFEVPKSVSEYILMVELSSKEEASWKITNIT